MEIDTIEQALRAKLAAAAAFGSRIAFDFGTAGRVLVDGTEANAVTRSADPADCTVSVTLTDLGRILDGSLDPSSAFMTGKLKIAGDMNAAMKLAGAL
jgi:putative sterol carrier protein